MAGSESYDDLPCTSADSDLPAHLKRRKQLLLSFSHSPIYCPISTCQQVLFPTAFMNHFLECHMDAVPTREAFKNERVIFTVNFESIRYGDIVCIGVLLYGGIRDQPDTRPISRYLSFENSGLLEPHNKYNNHMLVAVLATRTSWASTFHNKEMARVLESPNDERQHIFIIWCISLETTKEFFVTLTLHNELYTEACGVIRKVRTIRQMQLPNQFLSDDNNYLRATMADIQRLSSPEKICTLEVVLHEKPQIRVAKTQNQNNRETTVPSTDGPRSNSTAARDLTNATSSESNNGMQIPIIGDSEAVIPATHNANNVNNARNTRSRANNTSPMRFCSMCGSGGYLQE